MLRCKSPPHTTRAPVPSPRACSPPCGGKPGRTNSAHCPSKAESRKRLLPGLSSFSVLPADRLSVAIPYGNPAPNDSKNRSERRCGRLKLRPQKVQTSTAATKLLQTSDGTHQLVKDFDNSTTESNDENEYQEPQPKQANLRRNRIFRAGRTYLLKETVPLGLVGPFRRYARGRASEPC